jgi:hypothetical protein
MSYDFSLAHTTKLRGGTLTFEMGGLRRGYTILDDTTFLDNTEQLHGQ